MKQHKWHKEIKAWADGFEIEYKWVGYSDWRVMPKPDWSLENVEYRIKPQPQKTDKELAKELIKIPKVKAMVDKLIDRFTEPQYLYVNESMAGLTLSKYKETTFCIGKIKLEDTE